MDCQERTGGSAENGEDGEYVAASLHSGDDEPRSGEAEGKGKGRPGEEKEAFPEEDTGKETQGETDEGTVHAWSVQKEEGVPDD